MESQRTGRRGEVLAAQYLASRGWRILDRNWRFHHKEIDLVVERQGIVAFVEVKSRASDTLEHPLRAIHPRKQRDLATAARGWIARRGRRYGSFRFDAVIVLSSSAGVVVEHVEDAWRL